MSGTDVRWSVQRPPGMRQDGEWEDVGAEGGFEIGPAGTLLFKDADGAALVVYAAHAWETVTPA